MTIIIGSIDPIHRSKNFRAALATRGAANLWKEVVKFSGSSDGILNTANNFYALFAEKQRILLGTNRPITDDDILERILMSLHKIPAEKVNWHGA
ncbi:hypothetical protein OnM2_045075 [Erysiphe neolycopersici]|uniref:Uncharacterized protein n=1 Tax=Erysiphe neolycopersici TaxID=212602 RepID=A0A420HUE1_9PEZI|nr:hypothetical protein OnM2_045075 [Erysiphe neolycopersici]